MSEETNFYDFITANSAFVLTLVSLMGAGGSALGLCILKSRCTHYMCCYGCISCERKVLSETTILELANDGATTTDATDNV
jgi:hypothetical protein